MKKIFTLIFSLGLLTAAFAQEGGRHQRGYNSNVQNPSYGYQDHQRYGQDQTYQATPYANHVNWNNDRRDEDRYDRRSGHERGKDFRRRFDDRGYGDNSFNMGNHRHRDYWKRHRSRLSLRFGGY